MGARIDQSKAYLSNFNEARARLLLAHRFGLSIHTTIEGETFSVADLDFITAIKAMRDSYHHFIQTSENYDKLFNHLLTQLKTTIRYVNDKQTLKLLDSINQTIDNFLTPSYFETLPQKIQERSFFMIPVRTISNNNHNTNTTHNNHSSHHKEHMEGLAIFGDRMIKLNRGGISKKPSIRLYRLEAFEPDKLKNIIFELIQSLDKPVPQKTWDKDLNNALKADKVNEIIRKGESIGNSSWSTAKLFIYAAIYGGIFNFAKEKGLKDIDSSRLALKTIEYWYKMFTIDDRNRAISDYLTLHGQIKYQMPSCIKNRIVLLENFLDQKSKKTSEADKDLLRRIYYKSLNWHLSDYLNKGDIGAAHQMLDEQIKNLEWNPLAFAAKRNRLAVAEILSKDTHYVNRVDGELNTPLHLAAKFGRLAMIKILIKNKEKNHLNNRATNRDGWTVLHMAAAHNKPDIIEYLIKQDPELLNIMNNRGETAIKIASQLGNIEAVRALYSKDASLEGINLNEGISSDIVKVLRTGLTKPSKGK